MSTYEEKLIELADGKQLIRLSHPVRDRADTFCDACSSIQPRILYALKDQDSGRCYFVGTTYLEELARRGAILRRFGKDSGLAAYDSEMERRSQELKGTGTPDTNGTGKNSTIPESPRPDSDAESGLTSGDSHLFPTVFISETTDHCEAWAYILTPQGTVCSWGHSKECRYQEVWQMGGEKGMLLEKVKQARIENLQWTETELAEGKTINKFPRNQKVKLFRVPVSSDRTDYIATDDVALISTEATREVCGQRWKIEQFHRELQQTTGLEKCRCRKGRIQRNHIACAMLVWVRLKHIANKTGKTIYQLKRGLLDEYLIQQLRNPTITMTNT